MQPEFLATAIHHRSCSIFNNRVSVYYVRHIIFFLHRLSQEEEEEKEGVTITATSVIAAVAIDENLHLPLHLSCQPLPLICQSHRCPVSAITGGGGQGRNWGAHHGIHRHQLIRVSWLLGHRKGVKRKKNNLKDSTDGGHNLFQNKTKQKNDPNSSAAPICDVWWQKNNTRDSNVVPHRSTNLARQCLTSLSRREAVLSLWCGRSW